MKSHAPVSRSINLQAEPDELYPPLLSTSPAVVTFNVDQAATFECVAADEEASYEGITLHAGTVGGILQIRPEFILTYTGQWPARLILRALQQDGVVDEVSLLLHDTRSVVIDRMEAELLPNPAYTGDGFVQLVDAQARFRDAAGVLVPAGEMRWSINIPELPPGIILAGTLIRITPAASPGGVSVEFLESSGFNETVLLDVQPAPDIGLALNPVDMYPPCRSTSERAVQILHTLSPDADLRFRYELNDGPGTHPGLLIAKVNGGWALAVDRMFIGTYQGPWPASVRVIALLDGRTVATATMRLHDTRTMVCTSVDFEFLPDASVEIPDQVEIPVVPAPLFHDAEGISLPLDELDWEVTMIDPIEGVRMDRHVLQVSPQAKPGKYRIGLMGPNGLNRARVLTLR